MPIMAPDARGRAPYGTPILAPQQNPINPGAEQHLSRSVPSMHKDVYSPSAKNAQRPLMGIKTLDQHTTLIYELLLKSIDFDI